MLKSWWDSWIVTLDVLKYLTKISIKSIDISWIVTLDVLKLLQIIAGYRWQHCLIVTLDVLKYALCIIRTLSIPLNSNIRCIEI